jgi:hypothetical protein
MKLVLPEEVFSPAAMPDPRTLIADIKAKRLPGLLIGRRVYIAIDELKDRITESPAAAAEQPKSGRYRV